MKISYSRIELYNLCSQKYYYKYVEKLEADKTYTPLLFGSAIDQALNYVLLQVKDSKKINSLKAKKIFNDKMNEWRGQNELLFFKNEIPLKRILYPNVDFEELDSLQKQLEVHAGLCETGEVMIDTYIDEILPLFESIEDVQIEKQIKNLDGDILTIIIDFVAKTKDGKMVVFDNKTTSDIKKNYPKHSVKKSRQLSLYSDYYPSYHSGYIALQKKPIDGKIKWDIIVDKIDEEQTASVFEDIETKAQMIKDGKFQKNEKSCFSFGKKCEYWNLCKYGQMDGLKKREES